MYKSLVTIFIFVSSLFANDLQRNYFIHGDVVKLSDIVSKVSSENDTILFQLSNSKHIKRIKSKELLKILKTHGYKEFHSKYPYIQFNKISPIDTSEIKQKIHEHYKAKYSSIQIQSISVRPRTYMEKLPKIKSIEFPSREHLSSRGIVGIKTQENKKIFFNYHIKADVSVYRSKKELKRNDELSMINTRKNSIILDKFRAMPIQKIKKAQFQLKHNVKKDSLITVRDVEPLALIRRGTSVNVLLENGSIVITFSARALQDGVLGDKILVENDKGKKIKVIVTGKNKAKVR